MLVTIATADYTTKVATAVPYVENACAHTWRSEPVPHSNLRKAEAATTQLSIKYPTLRIVHVVKTESAPFPSCPQEEDGTLRLVLVKQYRASQQLNNLKYKVVLQGGWALSLPLGVWVGH